LKEEVTGKREIRRKQLLDDLKETKGYWTVKEEALDCSLWRTGFGRGCGRLSDRQRSDDDESYNGPYVNK